MSTGPDADFYRDEAFTRRFPIHRACRDGDVGALVSLLQQLSHRAPLTAEDSCYGWTPIHWAAHYGQLECVVLLVQMGCEVNTVTSRFNQTPTHTAAFGGHPDCVVWLTQAGADVNRQDFVGEAPVHKAARSGSLECIQVLLIAGAKPHLRNASGQTAADLARAHGFLHCSSFICGAQQPAGGTGGAACVQGPAGRKRSLTSAEAGHIKKARRDVWLQMQSSAAEELDSMNTDPSLADTKAAANGFHLAQPPAHQNGSTPQEGDGVSRRDASDMCGSLHLTGSSGAWRATAEADYDDPLRYGHYHGFGDTAEELTDGGIRLYHGS